jgi:hypothetical protein
MSNSTADFQIEMLQHRLTLFKTVYEEMISNETEFDSVKPISLQIRKLEKAIADIQSRKARSTLLNTRRVRRARIKPGSFLHLIKGLFT